MKYQPEYPEQFETIGAARQWVREFTQWYNEAHHHTGLALYTPEEVFTGSYEEVAKVREIAMTKSAAAFAPGAIVNAGTFVSTVWVSVIEKKAITAQTVDGRLMGREVFAQ